MAQVFSQQASQVVYLVLYGLLALVLVVPIAWVTIDRAPWVTGQYVALDQPVPFSHAHHVGEVGLSCQYCHQGVTTSASAGWPCFRQSLKRPIPGGRVREQTPKILSRRLGGLAARAGAGGCPGRGQKGAHQHQQNIDFHVAPFLDRLVAV